MKKIIRWLLLGMFAALLAGIFAACGGGSEESESSPSPQQLPAPSNFEIFDNMLLWDEDGRADGYVMIFNGKEETLPSSHYFFPEFTETETVTFRVKALGDGIVYADSEWSEYSYTYEKPTEALSYKLLPDGSGYEVTRKNAGVNTGLSGRVVIPDYYNGLPVKRIADDAFYLESLFHDPETGRDCNTVTTSVRLPAYLESIGENAFCYCLVLEEAIIPESVTEIGGRAFAWCLRLSKTNIPSGIKELSGTFAWTSISEITLPEGLTVIGNTVFSGCSQLRSIEIPDGVTKLGAGAFSGCECLLEIYVPDSVTEIGDEAFKGCVNLHRIRLPEKMPSLGYGILDETGWYEDQPEGYVILYGTILYGYKVETAESIEIKDLPEGIKYIAERAFYMCAELTSVTLHDGISFLGVGTFLGCNNLTEVILPSDLTEIPGNTFRLCRSLESIVLPEGLKSIGGNAFASCKALKSITIPKGIKSIGAGAFELCSALKSVTIPEGITVLENGAFFSCSSMESVVIPSTVTTIERQAFGYCTSLNVYYTGTQEEWENVAVNSRNNTAFLEAEKYFYSESEPELNEAGTEYEGNFWHYVNGEIVVWKKEEA